MFKFPFSLVDDVASHVKLFKKARLKCRQQKTDPNSSADLDSLFFDAEVAMEASSQEGNEICRDLVATIQQEEFMYLQNVSEILLFLLMPDVSINFGAQFFYGITGHCISCYKLHRKFRNCEEYGRDKNYCRTCPSNQ